MLTERAFIEGTQHLAQDTGSAKPGTADAAFRTGVLRLEVWKNLRLIVRTPMMMVQCLAQALMPIGIACVLGRDDIARAVVLLRDLRRRVSCRACLPSPRARSRNATIFSPCRRMARGFFAMERC